MPHREELRRWRVSTSPSICDNTRHDLLLSPVLSWIESLPSGQKRVFSWIINGLMLKVTISLDSHEDEQTCHFNRGSQATLVEGDLARVTASN